MLRQDSSLAIQFDKTYGEGAAAACCKPMKAIAGKSTSIPQVHIDKLLGNPGFAPDFDKVYGKGEAARILSESCAPMSIEGARTSNPNP